MEQSQLKIGVVGTPGGWSSEKLADAVYDRTGYRFLIDMEKVCFNLTKNRFTYEDTNLFDLDALVIKKIGAWYSPDLLDRLELLRFMSERGMKIFSDPLRILRVLDRLSCTVTLQTADIPMPETTVTEDIDCAMDILDEYGEAVFKPLYSTKAKGMLLLKKGWNARGDIEAFKKENQIMYIQKKIDHKGRDFGVVFMGGEYLTTYARTTDADNGSWNTTTRSGGKYKPYDPPESTIELAKKAQDLFGLDFTCVDIAETGDGPIVFEVSAFGGFRGIQTARNIDAAKLYVEYIINHTSNA